MNGEVAELDGEALPKEVDEAIQALKYLDGKLIEDMHRAMGLPPPNENAGRGAANMNDDMIEEDIPEDF